MRPIPLDYYETDIQKRVRAVLYDRFEKSDDVPNARELEKTPCGMKRGKCTAVCVIIDLDKGTDNADTDDKVMLCAIHEAIALLEQFCVDVSVCGNMVTAVFETVFKYAFANAVIVMSKIYSAIAIVNATAWSTGYSGTVRCRIGADFGPVTVSFAPAAKPDEHVVVFTGSAVNAAMSLASKPVGSAKVLRISEHVYDNMEPDYYYDSRTITDIRDFFTKNGKFYDSYMSDPALNDIFKSIKEEQHQST